MIDSVYEPDEYVVGATDLDFPITFEFVDGATIRATITSSVTDVETPLENGVDFDVVGVTLTTRLQQPEDDELLIYLEMPFLQQTDYNNSDKLDLTAIELSLDTLTLETQELKENSDRSVKVPLGSEDDPEDYLDTMNTLAGEAAQSASDASDSADIAAAEASTVVTRSYEALATAAQTDIVPGFTLSAGNYVLYINGVKYRDSDITLVGDDTLVVAALNLDDEIEVLSNSAETLTIVQSAVDDAEAAETAAVVAQVAAEAAQTGAEAAETGAEAALAEFEDLAPFTSKAWVNLDISGVYSFNGENIDTVDDNGVGDFTVNFIDEFVDTTFNAVGSGRHSSGGILTSFTGDIKTVSSMQLAHLRADTGAVADSASIGIAFFHEEATVPVP